MRIDGIWAVPVITTFVYERIIIGRTQKKIYTTRISPDEFDTILFYTCQGDIYEFCRPIDPTFAAIFAKISNRRAHRDGGYNFACFIGRACLRNVESPRSRILLNSRVLRNAGDGAITKLVILRRARRTLE